MAFRRERDILHLDSEAALYKLSLVPRLACWQGGTGKNLALIKKSVFGYLA
jgi:hypothetical protein